MPGVRPVVYGHLRHPEVHLVQVLVPLAPVEEAQPPAGLGAREQVLPRRPGLSPAQQLVADLRRPGEGDDLDGVVVGHQVEHGQPEAEPVDHRPDHLI